MKFIGLSSIQIHLLCMYLLIQPILGAANKKNKYAHTIKKEPENVLAEMQILCQSDAIVLKMNTNIPFNGMVYAKDAPNASNCVSEYNSARNMTFRLPLKSCGTLFAEADDGIEYFNTVIVQPHMRLMTNQGKGYHIRCKYQTRERTIANTHFNVSASFLMGNNQQATTTPLLATASMPSCTMKIFRSGRDDVAETVKIGDKLIMVIEIDQQDMYGMKITNCVVRDGMNLVEQQLINDVGCPIDEVIMPKFVYTNNSTRASVTFPAHKFPHTSSVYYQCNVRLCINNGGCDQTECHSSSSTPTSTSTSTRRRKRWARSDINQSSEMSFDVYSGLYVSDIDVGESGSSDTGNIAPVNIVGKSRKSLEKGGQFCTSFSRASFALVFACLASMGLSLMLACQVGVAGREDQQVSHSRLIGSSAHNYHIARNGVLGQMRLNK